MLIESEVIKYTCEFLKNNGFKIEKQLNETQKGDDIVAIKDNMKFYIEAKGQTSSKINNNRYGKEFSHNQKKIHFGEAFYRAVVMKEKYNSFSGMAFPYDEYRINLIQTIEQTLKQLEIEVFLVKEDGQVEVYNYSKIF